MATPPHLLLRFLLLYGALYCSFGFSSPFLPEFLTLRGVRPESLGLLLGAGTAVRLISAPVAGRLADVFRVFRLELSLFAILAAVVSLLYLPAHSLSVLALVNLTQTAMLAPWHRYPMHSRCRGLDRRGEGILGASTMAGCAAQVRPPLSLAFWWLDTLRALGGSLPFSG